jgi:hypothetical protein
VYYRDDTMIERSAALSERFDEVQDANGGVFPFTVGESVSLEWKHNQTTNRTIATKISRVE